jgi:hypothetical protein
MKHLVLWLAVVAAACSACTSYRALTPPPPSRTAALDNSRDRLELSQGVAIGFECITGWGNPCGSGQASTDDPKVAKVFPAHLAHVERYTDGSFTPTSYVVIGVSPGETVLRVAGEDPVRVVVSP